ncbi:GIY-YIG nuclease family protein [Roseisolibacter agri]|uniref:Nuclease n=1 Tax=Roseisolibacter agri TaxID=2014610 RepID=A0AA37QKY5_9BACT|nr:GIY-YIG nuclease family protein [Roseisolibacter agri]GLC27698.1 nuclease [Roseisolibacter agri]
MPYYVYILASHSRALYTGVTNDLRRRVWQHRVGFYESHTKRYRINRLVHFETTDSARAAIAREKQIKAWTREKRMALVEQWNAGWLDLSAGWYGPP